MNMLLRHLPILTLCLTIAGCTAASDASDPRDASPKPAISPEQQQALDRQLIEAAYHGNLNEVTRLLQGGANVNARYGAYDRHVFGSDDGGWSPLGSEDWPPLLAVSGHDGPENRVQIAQFLLDHGADPDLDDGHGSTALYSALSWGHKELAKLLIDRGANVNTRTRVYIDAPQGTPLHEAVKLQDPQLVALLLSKGADPNGRGTGDTTSLHYAGMYGTGEVGATIAKQLLDAGAKVDATTTGGATPLMSTAHQGHSEVMRVLLEAGADVNATAEDGNTPLLEATWWNDDEQTIRLLLDARAEINVKNEEGSTPLLNLAWKERFALMRELLAMGAKPVGQDAYGLTSLHFALLHQQEDLARGLIEADADVQAVDIDGNRPLHMAQSPAMARLLLQRGADPNVRDDEGRTPLHNAVGNAQIVKLLIEAGADVNAQMEDGRTPLQLAERGDHADSAKLLREAIAETEPRDH